MTDITSEHMVWGDRWEAIRESHNRRGGQGQVWAFRDRQDGMGRVFALKLLDPKVNVAKLKRFALEIRATQDLRQTVSGIVEIIDSHVGETPGSPSYYVMPWASATLKDRTSSFRGPAGLERTLQLVGQVARTLAACHQATPRVIHRDVKPANILLDVDESTPLLADFGICFLEEDERLTHTQNDTMGSYGFTAPELFGGGATENVGPANDIYSLGKTIYAVVSGGAIFPLDRHREGSWYLTEAAGDHRLEHVHGLLDHMTALRPEQRFAGMVECIEAIDQAIEHLRNGVRYVEGMYGGERRAARRLHEVRHALAKPNIDAQNRAFVAAINDAVADAKRVVADAGRLPSVRPGRSVGEYQVPEVIAECVALVADELLSPICAVMASDEGSRALVEEWVERLTVETSGRAEDDAARLLRAGASTAAHVAGAIAWRQGLMSSLAAIMNAHLPHLSKWNHLDVFDRASLGIMQVGARVMEDAASLTWLDKQGRTNARDSLSVYSGLLLVRDFEAREPEIRAILEAGEVADVEVPALPCFYYPHTDWTALLGDDCAASRLRRGALAREVFGLDDVGLREMLRRYRSAVIRFIARCNPDRSMHHMGFPNYALWGKWS